MKLSKKQLATGLIAFNLLVGGGVVLAMSSGHYVPNEAKAATSEAFDHSNCQYPDRWSNPVDGCDNSDPAVPECIKGWSTQAEEAACIDAYVKSQTGTAEKQAEIQSHDAAFQQQQPVTSCSK